MATIIIRNSTGSGAVPSSLVQGELAINTVDGKLFYGSGSGNVVKEFTGSASGGSTNTGSLLTTASFSNPNLTFTKGDGSTFNTSLISLVPTSASYALTASFVATASWATNAITANTASYILNAVSSSFAISSSFASTAQAAASADTAKAVNTLASSTNADFYPTFVDSNNSPTAASENVYTSNRITFNPSTQLLTVPRISSTSITASAFTGSLTGSLLGTASYAVQALSASWAPSVASNPFPYTGSAIISGSLVVTGSLIAPSITGSLQGTASWATNARTASFLSAGTYNITAQNANNIYISTNSTPGTYTIPVYAAGGEDSNNSIASSNASYDQTNGHFTMTVLSSSLFGTASYATVAQTLLGSVTSASFASTASFVNTLNQNVIITSGLAIGTSSLGSTENALVVGLPPAGGVGEGGQILLQASGGLYTTASMIDNYQNKFRILRGTNASSDAFKFQVDMHTGQVSIPNYNSATALTGSGVAMLGVDSSGNVLTTTIPGTTIFGQYGGTGFTNPIVTYLPFGFTTVSGTEAQRQVASPVAGSLKNFFLRTNNTSVAGSTTTFTIRVNGVNTNVKITIGGGVAAAKFSDTTNSASIAVGDEISLQVSTSVGNGPQVNAYSFGIYPS